MFEDVIFSYNEEKAKLILEKLVGKNPLFICTIATTHTAKIPGISAAGKNPELTDYTPAADVEYLYYDKCLSISGVPVTPEGIPTPALITASALKLAQIPLLVVNAGASVKPKSPYIEVGGKPGGNIRDGRGVENPAELYQNAKILGEHLSKIADYLIIGESVPGGTTTALGVMLALGIDARDKISSSLPANPHGLKRNVVEEGMKKIGAEIGEFRNDPLKAVEHFGDPMMPVFLGIVSKASERVPVLLAGGTQMAAIIALLYFTERYLPDSIVIATTRWIVEDRSSDLRSIIAEISEVPIVAVNLNFGSSVYKGLNAYELGYVKEGVGAGGASLAAILKSKGKIRASDIVREVERRYKLLTGS